MTTPADPQRPPVPLVLRLLLVALLLPGLALRAAAGAPAAQEGDGASQERAEAPPAAIYETPSAVVREFLAAMGDYHGLRTYDDEQLARALGCFHVAEGQVTRTRLRELAIQLYESLSRMGWIDPALQVQPGPDDRDVEWQLDAIAVKPSPLTVAAPTRVQGVLPFVRVDAGGEASVPNWRFGPELLQQIPRWHAQLEGAVVRRDIEEALQEGVERLPLRVRLGHEFRSRMPERLRREGFLLRWWQWILLASLVLTGVVLGRVVAFGVRRGARRVERSERLRVDKQVLLGFERPFGLWISAWFLLGMLPSLQLEPRAYDVLRLAVASFLAVGGVWAAYRLVDVGAALLAAKAAQSRNRFDDMLVPLLRRTAKILLTFVGVIYVASYLSEDLYGIVAGLSIGSLAVGFAAKDSIENMFGTATVLMDKPYQLGDWITVGDIDGTVESVGFRSTKIRTFWNSLITVPNSRFISAHTENWGARRYRRIKTMVSLAYDTPPLKIEAFCEAVRELIRKHPYTRKDYYHVYLNELAASALNVLVYCFVETPDWSTELREKHRLFLDILRVAQGLEVEIAFPTQTLHLRGQGAGPREQAPPAPPEGEAGYGVPDDVDGARRVGRELADLLVREELAPFGGEKPPPVVID